MRNELGKSARHGYDGLVRVSRDRRQTGVKEKASPLLTCS